MRESFLFGEPAPEKERILLKCLLIGRIPGGLLSRRGRGWRDAWMHISPFARQEATITQTRKHSEMCSYPRLLLIVGFSLCTVCAGGKCKLWLLVWVTPCFWVVVDATNGSFQLPCKQRYQHKVLVPICLFTRYNHEVYAEICSCIKHQPNADVWNAVTCSEKHWWGAL